MKLQSIQFLRGCAVSIVVVHHFMSPFYNFEHTNIIGDFFSNYGAFGVDIFFVISGFIMAYILYNSNTDAKRFMLNRIIRIIPNYWFWNMVLLFMTIYIGVDTLFVSDERVSTIIMSLLFITHDHPSPLLGYYPLLTPGWTLNIEMFFYSTIAILLLLRLKTNLNLVILTILFLLFPILWRIFDIEFYTAVIGNARLVEFSAGIIIAICWHDYKKFFFNMIFFIVATILVVSLFLIPISHVYKWIILSSILVYMVLILEDTKVFHYKIAKYFIYLGEMSFSLYLAHGIVMRSFYYFFGKIDSNLEFILIFSSAVTVSLVIAKLSYEMIEIKFSKYLKNSFMYKNQFNVGVRKK